MSTRVRVAFLQAWLTVGGAERIVETLVRGLDPARFDVRVANLYAPGEIGERLERDGHATTSHLARASLDPVAGMRLAAFLRREAIDVVHVFDSALPMAWAGLLRRLRTRPALVLGFHSNVRLGGRLSYAFADALALPVTDRFVALSRAHRDLIASRHGLPTARFEVIPSGVDLARFRPAADRSAARRDLGLERDAFVVGLVAALRPEKRPDLFVEVARGLAARVPLARFVVAGSGSEAGRLRAAVESAELSTRFRLLGSREDVPAIWAAIDVAVLTSRTEALPVSLLEAHACGVPAVSTDVGSVRDIVADGETGWIVPEGDTEACIARLEALAREPDRRRAMALAARARAEQRFGLERMIDHYQALFESVTLAP